MMIISTRFFDRAYCARVGVLALCYFVAAKISLYLAIPPGYATAVWLPSGIALAGLFLMGTRLWPGIWLGAALANYTVSASLPLAFLIATGNTLEGVGAAWLTHRFIGPNLAFRAPESVFLFAAIAAAASVVAATPAVSALFLSGAASGAQLSSNWYTWWLGDTTGILVITPLVLAWTRRSWADKGEASGLEVLIFSVILILALIIFFGAARDTPAAIPLAFPLLPFLVWSGCRFSERAVTLIVLVVSVSAIWSTSHYRGPFHLADLNQSLLLLQAFTSTIALMGLVLRALTRQRADAARAVALSREALEITVDARTAELRAKQDQLGQELLERIQIMRELERHQAHLANAQTIANLGSWEWDVRSNSLLCSDQLLHIYGLEREEFQPTLEGFLARIPPEGRGRVSAIIQGALDGGGTAFEFEMSIVRPQGGLRTLFCRVRVDRDETGRALHLLGACQDVTERKQTETDLRNYAEQITSISQQLITLQELETQRLGRELHSLVGPHLTAMGINLQLIMQLIKTSLTQDARQQFSDLLANCVSLVQTMAGATRQLMGELRPLALDDHGLLAALRIYAAQFSKQTGIRVDVGGEDVAGLTPRPVELAMFRIAQEALHNVAKHSRVNQAAVTLSRDGKGISLSVEDAGVGFDPGSLRPVGTGTANGWGLLLMRERAEAVGARFNVDTGVASHGVRVRVDYPQQAAAPPEIKFI